MKRNSPAFTLLELLVVIAILALLAALVMPAMSIAKDHSKTAICRNNLSQIGTAMAVYTSDFGKYPGTRSAPVIVPPHTTTQWDQIWDHRLLPYVSGNQITFLCPADKPHHSLPFLLLTNYTYGYNAYGSGVLPPSLNLGLGRARPPETDASGPILEIAESQVRLPSDMITIGDLTDLPSVFTTTLTPFTLPPYAGCPAARHNGGANMVFCDGHTELARRTKWVEETGAARSRWNNDHEPHPETWTR